MLGLTNGGKNKMEKEFENKGNLGTDDGLRWEEW